MTGFSKDDIIALLTEVGEELDRDGLRGELFVVGGAAIALAYNARRATRDIDGVFEPKAAIYRAAALVGARHDLDEGWLNDAVKGLLPGPDPDAIELLDTLGFSVSVPSPQYLLALKVAAARVDRDADDIRLLAELCGLSSATEILDLTERVIGKSRPLEVKVQYLIEEMFSVPGYGDGIAQARLLMQGLPKGLNRSATTTPHGICGYRTLKGEPCQNPRGSCPHHH